MCFKGMCEVAAIDIKEAFVNIHCEGVLLIKMSG